MKYVICEKYLMLVLMTIHQLTGQVEGLIHFNSKVPGFTLSWGLLLFH